MASFTLKAVVPFALANSLCAAAQSQQLTYAVTSGGSIAENGILLRMNNRGQTIGAPSETTFTPQIGVQFLPPDLAVRPRRLYGINDAGAVCGVSFLNGIGEVPATGPGPLQIHYLSINRGEARAINNRGDVIGESGDAEGVAGVVWQSDGHIRTVPLARASDVFTLLQAINDSGDIAGISAGTMQPLVPVLWRADGSRHLLATADPLVLPYVHAINAAGQIAGLTQRHQQPAQACVWNPAGPTTQLGVLPGYTASLAFGINDFGVVVGESHSATNTGYSWSPTGSGFLWTPATGMIALDSLLAPESRHWHIVAGCDINEHGEIAAFAYNTNFSTVLVGAVLLRPNRVNLADIAGAFNTTLPDGQLNADDVVTFISEFFNNAPVIADLASPGGIAGPDGRLTADDVILFLSSFFSGQ